jgi:GST-like protein
MSKLKLFGEPGWGSVLIEAQLVWYNIPFEFHKVGDLFSTGSTRSELETFNPLGQIPTLVLPDCRVMTESAAITLWLADQSKSSELVPESDAQDRAQFLRWLIFITSNIYPTYTYADDPARFVLNKAAQNEFTEAVSQYVKKLYKMLNAEASSPWFLGERFSAIDIYICTMTHWRPRRQWFAANTSNLVAIADTTKAIPRLSQVWARNFSEN